MRSQSLSVLLGVKVNTSLHFLVSLCLSLTLSLCISLSLFASLSLCVSFPPYVLLSVCLSVCLSLWLCLLVFLVSLHKFVSSQKCGEIVVSLCVCVSVSPAPLPKSLCGWHLALVVVVFGPGLIYAHFVLWPKNAMRCTVNVLVSPRRLLCTALPPPSSLPHSHTHTHTHAHTRLLFIR